MTRINKLIVVIGLTAALLSGVAVSALADPPEKVTICHAAGQEGTTKFVTLTLPFNAVYGQAGHFNEDGTTQAGHEDDYEGPCVTTSTTSSSTTSSTVVALTTTTAQVTTTSSGTSTTQPPTTTTSLPTTTTSTSLVTTTTEPQTTTTLDQTTTTLMTELPFTGPEDLPIFLALSLLAGGVLLLGSASLLGRRDSGS